MHAASAPVGGEAAMATARFRSVPRCAAVSRRAAEQAFSAAGCGSLCCRHCNSRVYGRNICRRNAYGNHQKLFPGNALFHSNHTGYGCNRHSCCCFFNLLCNDPYPVHHRRARGAQHSGAAAGDVDYRSGASVYDELDSGEDSGVGLYRACHYVPAGVAPRA